MLVYMKSLYQSIIRYKCIVLRLSRDLLIATYQATQEEQADIKTHQCTNIQIITLKYCMEASKNPENIRKNDK